MILMIDNYDSFTYNIVQYLQELSHKVVVKPNDAIDIIGIETLSPTAIVVGPGPCSPKEAGISVATIQHFAGKIPLLGVCLGLQSMAAAFGGSIVRAKTLMHGKVSPVHHDNQGVFKGLPNPVNCTRYHSLAVDKNTLPHDFVVSATTDDGEVMAIRHKNQALEAVQFHPEALLTEHGHQMFRNFFNTYTAKN